MTGKEVDQKSSLDERHVERHPVRRNTLIGIWKLYCSSLSSVCKT
jgi:hypothetical protein